MKNNTVLKIKSTHATLTEAVAASGMDLSYNPKAAEQKIQDISRAHRGSYSGKAFVMESGDVLYIYHCDINLLNKFDPFISCMDNCSFFAASIRETEIEIVRCPMGRDMETRKIMARLNDVAGIAFTTL